MRILIATGLYPPDIGGPATYSKLLHDELPKHGVAVKVLPFSTVRHLPNVLRQTVYFFKVLKHGEECDVIYTQDAVSVGWPAFFANLFLRKKFLVKIVGDYAWEQGRQRFAVTESLSEFPLPVWRYGFWLGWLRFLQFLVVRNADSVIVPSEYLKKIVINWGVASEKITVIYNAFNPPNVQSVQSAEVKPVKTIVSIGRLVPWKGFGTLIGLIPQLREIDTDIKLIIIGDGPERHALGSMVKNQKLEACVSFTGQVSHERVLEYLKAADVFVLNTGYEGFSHQILEALAIGTPVVTTTVGGNPELIEDGQNGLLVSHDDRQAFLRAITKILSDKNFAEQLVRAGQKSVERFSTERMLSETLILLQQL